jgi:hypothetical protein
MRLRPMTIIAALTALVLAGCGSSSKSSSAGGSSTSSGTPSLSSFKAGFVADRATFRKLGSDLQSEITGAASKTDAQLATELSALSDRAKQQATAISNLGAPAQYQTDVQNLSAAFNAVSADLHKISVAATNHDGPAAKTATETLLQDAAKVKAADDAITSGLKLPANS